MGCNNLLKKKNVLIIDKNPFFLQGIKKNVCITHQPDPCGLDWISFYTCDRLRISQLDKVGLS